MNAPTSTLIVGIGNPARGDDGAGWAVVGRLDPGPWPDVEIRCQQQLQIEDAADWSLRRRVIVIDASLDGPPVQCRRVGLDASGAEIGTHRADPRAIAALSRTLWGDSPEVILCTVRGESFGFATELSAPVHHRVDQLAGEVLDLLRSAS